jgi:hypothetical protein
LAEQCRRTLTLPSTLAVLLAIGGLAGARSRVPKGHRVSSLFGAMLRWIVKGVATLAFERAMRGRRDEAATPLREDNAS